MTPPKCLASTYIPQIHARIQCERPVNHRGPHGVPLSKDQEATWRRWPESAGWPDGTERN